MTNIGKELSNQIAEATRIKTSKIGIENAEKNRQYFRKTIKDLPKSDHSKSGESAIVIVGGPSLHRKNPVKTIQDSGFKGDIIVADGALGYCLTRGLIPKYVVCLDTNPKRIVRWFGDTQLVNVPDDDYYRRQDLDKDHWKDELGYNRQLIKLVNLNGKKIKALLSTSIDPSVTRRCVDSGMDIYWWNPLYDDPYEPDSISRKLFNGNGIPCMVTGGNVGTAAWILSHAALNKKHVALAGMDLGYAPGTPLINTQYYYELVELLGDKVADAFIQIYNPYLNETWFTDPTYHWYRKVFLDLAKDANCTTYNCTEGGTLFDDPVKFIPLVEFLTKFSPGNR